ncbi:7-cyano-7-deazaguanine/7-aminomethyl-7-deazaguanine transporter [Suttonella sp. R2A3]|uniref:7-cyano-7-deazaguanine/7-aminomethyl-7- deazaguanine transporter n=1 Tax=Suttonella sp. R2A3 TaxID=2908648 RepID=UPI001F329983|nr:7-cyano-7-deazaguanine/7-aminomethyl-7-deazaguanine transporter [Suttonella sp. R2A3]UJF24183.1 7-cyano-7-deazaguanine/7-aminomethyl-7-deazaguanine transporter [Suttonella sp. R2A3]
MLSFTPEQQRHALIWLSFWHIFIIALSNFLVQFPFEFYGLHTTWGAFSFPFIFLTTDLTVRVFGPALARKIIFCVMFPALAISYVVSVLFHNGSFTDLSVLTSLNTFVARIALASFAAYLIGQLLDISVFNYLRRHHRWWVAPSASTVLGNAIDTIVFFSIAFYASSDPFMAANWPEIALLDYAWKIIICTLFFLPAYGLLLRYLLKRLTTLDPHQPSNVASVMGE